MVRRAGVPPRTGAAPDPLGGARGRDASATSSACSTGGYDELFVISPVELAALILSAAGPGVDPLEPVLGPAERFAMLLERIDAAVDRAARLRRQRERAAGGVHPPDRPAQGALSGPRTTRAGRRGWRSRTRRSSASSPRSTACTSRCWPRPGARDAGDLIRDALRVVRERPAAAQRFEHVLVDDAHDLDLAAATLSRAVAGSRLTAAADPSRAGRRLRRDEFAEVITLEQSLRLPAPGAARGVGGGDVPVRADRGGRGGRVLALRERAGPGPVGGRRHRAPDRRRGSVRRARSPCSCRRSRGRARRSRWRSRSGPSPTAWSARRRSSGAPRSGTCSRGCGCWPTPPTRPPWCARSRGRRSSCARSTSPAARRSRAGASSTWSRRWPRRSSRRRCRRRRASGSAVFLKLYRAGMSTIDSTRPDLYVHRLIDRLGLRRQQLFAAQADVVQRLRALARFGELAGAYARALPAGDAARVRPPHRRGRRLRPARARGARPAPAAGACRSWRSTARGALEAEHVYVLGLHAGLSAPAPEPIARRRLSRTTVWTGRAATDRTREAAADGGRTPLIRQVLYVAVTRARRRVVLAYPCANDRSAALAPAPLVETMRRAVAGAWEDREEEMFGPAETLHSTYRLLRDEVLEGTMRAGGRLGELRLDTDLDVSHAVVRYLELLKLAALIERPEGQSLAEAVRDVNSRILQAVTAEQREIYTSSALGRLSARRRARRAAAGAGGGGARRSVGRVVPAHARRRGRAVGLGHRHVPDLPLEIQVRAGVPDPAGADDPPAVRDRRAPGARAVPRGRRGRRQASLPELLGLLDASWRRGGFGESEEERQLRGKAAAALTRYHTRFQSEEAEPMWFERAFSFKLGPHLLRGRVDRVDRLPGRRIRADRLQDRASRRARRSSSTTCSCRCTRSAPARRGASMPPSRRTTTCSTTRR